MIFSSQATRLNAPGAHALRASCVIAIFIVSLALSACSDNETTPSASESSDIPTGETTDTDSPVTDQPTNNPPDSNSQPPAGTDTSARYRLTFQASWSEATHALNFPGNPHFSGLIGAVHNEQVRFWEPGQIASAGIQLMAETGSKSDFRPELQASIDAGSALTLLDGGGVSLSPGTISIEFEVTRDYPQLTLTSMLAPSPDWFVGVHNFSLLVDDAFIESESIALFLYDAGSDSGARYTSANAETSPLSPVVRLTSETQDSPFINGSPEVGVFLIERIGNS